MGEAPEVHANSVCAVAFWVMAHPNRASLGPVLGAIRMNTKGLATGPVAATAAGTLATPPLLVSPIVATPSAVAAPSVEPKAQTPAGEEGFATVVARRRAAERANMASGASGAVMCAPRFRPGPLGNRRLAYYDCQWRAQARAARGGPGGGRPRRPPPPAQPAALRAPLARAPGHYYPVSPHL